jgi:hypothetical protein
VYLLNSIKPEPPTAVRLKKTRYELSTIPGVAAIQEPGGDQVPIIQ